MGARATMGARAERDATNRDADDARTRRESATRATMATTATTMTTTIDDDDARARRRDARRARETRARAGRWSTSARGRRARGEATRDRGHPGRRVQRGRWEEEEKKRAGGSRDGGAQFERRPMGTTSSARDKWIKVGNVSELEEKPIKALLLANGNFCMVKYGSMVFITACNSTAYQYPLIDGELFEGPSGAAIRVPLDGTEYDLATGEVITWCPQNNMMRKFLGGLKKAATPVPLAVYPTKIDSEGDVFTYFI